MKQIKWFRNLFLIGATSFMLLSVVACKHDNKKDEKKAEEKKPVAKEFTVTFSAEKLADIEISDDDLKKLVVAKKGTETITSGTKVAKDTEITFEFAKDAKGLALKEWSSGVAAADKAKRVVKVKITADTTVKATMQKMLTFALEIHHAAVDLDNNTVTIPFGKTQVTSSDFSATSGKFKCSYYGTDKKLKTEDIAHESFTTVTGISATETKDVKITIKEDTTKGYAKWEHTIKATAEKDKPKAKIVALKLFTDKVWKEGDKVLKTGATNTSFTKDVIVADKTVIEFKSGVLKGKQLAKTGTASATLIVDSTFAPAFESTSPVTLDGTEKDVVIKATYANAEIADLTIKATAQNP